MKKIYLLILVLTVLVSCFINPGPNLQELQKNYWKKPYSHLSYKEAIETIKTPEEVIHYLLNQLNYVPPTTFRSFKYVHELGYGTCTEYAVAAAALLSDDGYPPLFLTIRLSTGLHTCYIYQDKTTHKWGTLGIHDNRPATFNDPKELCTHLKKVYPERFSYPTFGGWIYPKILDFSIHDLSKVNFIDSDEKIIYTHWLDCEDCEKIKL